MCELRAALLAMQTQAPLEAIAAETRPRTFENTMRALGRVTEQMDFAMAVVKYLESVATSCHGGEITGLPPFLARLSSPE